MEKLKGHIEYFAGNKRKIYCPLLAQKASEDSRKAFRDLAYELVVFISEDWEQDNEVIDTISYFEKEEGKSIYYFSLGSCDHIKVIQHQFTTYHEGRVWRENNDDSWKNVVDK